MSKKKFNLVVVAHPDDETIFFAGAILAQPHIHWQVALVTDGNADKNGEERIAQFRSACRALGVKKLHLFNMPDIYSKRLNPDQISHHFDQIETPQSVYTHGPLGEYGHPHHQDVSFAVHRHYRKLKIISPAYNCEADEIIKLSTKNYRKKCHILAKIYFDETKRFSHFLPSHSIEGYTSYSFKEVQTLYRFFTSDSPIKINSLNKLKWFAPYLHGYKKIANNRSF